LLDENAVSQSGPAFCENSTGDNVGAGVGVDVGAGVSVFVGMGVSVDKGLGVSGIDTVKGMETHARLVTTRTPSARITFL
jgi:hypothetical protein